MSACEQWARRAARMLLPPLPQTPAEGAGNLNELRGFDLRTVPAHEPRGRRPAGDRVLTGVADEQHGRHFPGFVSSQQFRQAWVPGRPAPSPK